MPIACRFKTLRQALAAAATASGPATVTATGASAAGTMTFAHEVAGASPTPLTVPANVTLTTDGIGTYVIALDDDGGASPAQPTLAALMKMQTGATLSHFQITESNAASLSTMLSVGDAAGTTTIDTVQMSASVYDALRVINGTLVASTLDVHDNTGAGIVIEPTAGGLTLTASAVAGNYNGLVVQGGTTSVSGSTFDGNHNGIALAAGELTVNAGVIIENGSVGIYASVDFDASLSSLASTLRTLHVLGTALAPVVLLHNTFAGIIAGGYNSHLDGIAGATAVNPSGDDPVELDATHLQVSRATADTSGPLGSFGLVIWNGTIYDGTTSPPAHHAFVSASSFSGYGSDIQVGRSYATGAIPHPTVLTDCSCDHGNTALSLAPSQNQTQESYDVKVNGATTLSSALAGLRYLATYPAQIAVSIDGADIVSNTNGIVLADVPPATFQLRNTKVHSSSGDQVSITRGLQPTSAHWVLSGGACGASSNSIYCDAPGFYAVKVANTDVTVDAVGIAWDNADPGAAIFTTGNSVVTTGYSATPASNQACGAFSGTCP